MISLAVVDFIRENDFYSGNMRNSSQAIMVTEVQNENGPVANKGVRIYFAGPLFTQAEWQWNATLAKKLKTLGYAITLPQESAEPMLTNKRPFDANELFRTNVNGIDSADIVVAILDQPDPDSGTCWECGYAFKLGKPVVGVRSDIRRAGDDPKTSVNLMLGISCARFVDVPLGKRNDVDWVATAVDKAIVAVSASSNPANTVVPKSQDH
jgi:nucleoside 2-deoxyribosyltransferase